MSRLFICLLASTLSFSAMARDEQNNYLITEALDKPEAKQKIDANIPLFFAGQKAPTNAKKLGEWSTNKKTNAFNKTDQVACEWAFLGALLALQDRARKEGGDAVIDIKSNYKNIETSSATEYTCGNGALMAGVALKGTIVKRNGK